MGGKQTAFPQRACSQRVDSALVASAISITPTGIQGNGSYRRPALDVSQRSFRPGRSTHLYGHTCRNHSLSTHKLWDIWMFDLSSEASCLAPQTHLHMFSCFFFYYIHILHCPLFECLFSSAVGSGWDTGKIPQQSWPPHSCFLSFLRPSH